ncbi:hypothetical protein [Arsenicicoccus sp. oral taxon 190]|uniref:hypothetical protein n=1 Tax=Arsenicicoccus sp. oral taxon 190 TaxID=1658671 RepID=UPI000ADECC76|nr:hypothetical protein [Arsenicicoccus sp. oral taxon 190]
MGGSTMGTLAANAAAPGVLDRYLAWAGFSSQQSKQDRGPDQPANLWEPADADRDFGTHGVFDARAKSWSSQLWASQHHGLLGAVGGAGAVAVAGLLARRR